MAPTLPRFCFHLAEQDNWPFIQLAVGALVPDTLRLKRAACALAPDHPLLETVHAGVHRVAAIERGCPKIVVDGYCYPAGTRHAEPVCQMACRFQGMVNLQVNLVQ